MPFKLPLRTRSTKVKSPAISSRGRKETLSHTTSSARKSSRPRSTYDEQPVRIDPSSSSRRTRSHDRPPLAPSAYSRGDDIGKPGPPRRRSSHRSSISPRPGSPRSSPRPTRSERQARYSDGRRQSPSPFSRRHSPSPGGHSSAAQFGEFDRRGRASSASQAYAPGVQLPKPTFAEAIRPPVAVAGHHASVSAQPSSGHRRGSTPPKYRPVSAKSPISHARRNSHDSRDNNTKHPARDHYYHSSHHNESNSVSPAPSHEESESFLKRIPGTVATHAAISALSKHAGTAKEWAERLSDLKGAPDEIQSLSSRVSTARDTIKQIQGSLVARPDLLEDETGQMLKIQIEDAIDNTSKTLGEMTKMLVDLTGHAGEEGSAWRGVNDLWNSYIYKTEGEGKVRAADADLQEELTGLSTLMVNLYSRALMKEAPKHHSQAGSPPAAASPPAASPMTVPYPTPIISPPALSPNPAASPLTADSDTTPVSPLPPSPPVIISLPPIGTRHQMVSHDNSKVNVSNAAGLDPTNAKVLTTPHPKHAEVTTPSAEDPETLKTPDLQTSTTGSRCESLQDSSSRRSSLIPGHLVNESVPEASQIQEHPPKRPSLVPGQDAYQQPNPRVSQLQAVPPRSPSRVALEEENIGSGSTLSSAAVGSPEVLGSDPKVNAQERVLDAAWEGNIHAVADALRDAPINTCDLRGLTPLHLAVERDHLAVAILLIDRGADVHARANGKRSPLHLAARFASADTVEMLLERGKADANAQTSDGRTPLHYAASAAEDGNEERREVIRVLRDWGADPTVEDNKGETPREVAQKRDYWDAASTLRRAERKWEGEHHQNWLQRHGLMK